MDENDIDDPGILPNWFLGPRAEYRREWADQFAYIFQDYAHWRRNYSYGDPAIDRFSSAEEAKKWEQELDYYLGALTAQLKKDYPIYSPRYIAHMLSETTLPAVLGYFAGMLYNPNNISQEAAPVTAGYEIEVGRLIATMLGFDEQRAWAHITSGGTVANLEALWIARTSNFVPLILKDLIETKLKVAQHPQLKDFKIRQPNGIDAPIVELRREDLLELSPCTVLSLHNKFVDFCLDKGIKFGCQTSAPLNDVQQRDQLEKTYKEYFCQSEYNPNTKGLVRILKDIAREPVILVSEARHYCIPKAAQILGLGDDQVIRVPVDSDFRINVDALESRLNDLDRKKYVLAVIGIAGTTEEGAVDRIDEILCVRGRREQNNKSFWLHVDAAWGGYIASMLTTGEKNRPVDDNNRIRKFFEYGVNSACKTLRYSPQAKDDQVFDAIRAVGRADSVIIDPHKLGYVPYPAGVVAFRDNAIKHWYSQDAPYIGQGAKENPELLGPYILEGSKPGAAAAACWLAHQAIPLNMHGHGRIVGETLLNARLLWSYLESTRQDSQEKVPLVALCPPDTNIVCFVANPKKLKIDIDSRCAAADRQRFYIETLNRINEKIYETMSLPGGSDGTESATDPILPQMLKFFVSRTRMKRASYSECWTEFLNKLGLTDEGGDTKFIEIFVLRSTVMSPWYSLSRRADQHEKQHVDYLLNFVRHIQKLGEQAYDQVERVPDMHSK